MLNIIYKTSLLFLFFFFITNNLKAELVENIKTEGTQRISSETIKMFAGVSTNEDLSENDLNQILKKLYNTNFFEMLFC